MSIECQICCEDCKKSVMVDCIGCDSIICRKCHQKYILNSIELAHCMNCKTKWNYPFLYKAFTKTWVNKDYRNHMKKISLDREKSKIPQTLNILPQVRIRLENKERLRELNKRKSELLAEISEMRNEIYRLERNPYYDPQARPAEEIQPKERKLSFICPCPDEDCRGMIESRTFKCGVCDQIICKSCRAAREKEDNHECNQEDIETMKLIRKDTKPCPQCAVPIYKISGCHQMFCTQCQIVFDWRTGKKEAGWVHNPHALQWQREHGGLMRDVRDIRCGGLIDINDLMAYFKNKQCKTLTMIHQFMGEIDYTLRSCGENDFENLRLEYVLNRITEKQWQQRIFNVERANLRKSTMRDILTNLRTLVTERFRNLLEACETKFLLKHPNAQLHMVNNWGWRSYPQKSSRSNPDHEEDYQDFIRDIQVIREFTNKAIESELPPLGTTTPKLVTDEWKWDHGVILSIV